MNSKDLKIAKEVKNKISQITELVDFKVFGSRARDEADEYSDMDLFIEVPSLNKSIKDQISNIVWQVGFKNLIVISPLIYTKHEIEDTPLRSSPIVKNIKREGVAV